MNAIRRILRVVFRLAIVWGVDTISLIVTAALLRNITLSPVGDTPAWVAALLTALVLGVVNFLIRPLILLLALPFGFFALFGVGFLVNALVLLIASDIVPGFQVNGLLAAIIGSIVLSIVNTILTTLIDVDDDSFYMGLIERRAKAQSFKGATDHTTGLVMVEIDGLSWHHIQKAIGEGYMPTLKKMMEEEGYELTRVDCGLPSQTSACQAGIMFGDNYDIPAFRWYDKDKQHLFVSGKDAAELNARYAKGQGLMRDGSSINNMLNGDAEKSLFTLANMKTGSDEEKKRRADDVYLLMRNPYFFMRTISLFIGDAIRDVWQGWQQKRKDVQPRLNRLHHFYPFVRAATTTIMRDIPMYFVSLDIVRGSPAIYYTFPGYDEVAHHSGPWTSDAFGVLRQFDRVIAHLKSLIERKAPRPYELVLLSDHGQSFGHTFKMRYGVSLKEFIEQHMPAGATVSHTSGGDDGVLSVGALATELENAQTQGKGGVVGTAVMKQTTKLAQRGVDEQSSDEAADKATPDNVVAYGSGNLAQVYFDLFPRKIILSELNAAYPGLVDALVQHEGIGYVVGYQDDGAPVILGKVGARNLHTGEVTGEDPLKPYADDRASVEFRAEQVRRVIDFPHAGDLMVISTIYPDGTVAALEELIGSHGGMGGEQTDAFLFHPKAWGEIPQTKNSADVFHILNARRGLPAPMPQEKRKEKIGEVNPWAVGTLASGVSQVGKWVGLAGRSIVLDRAAYREASDNPFMTGPALLIGVVASILASIVSDGGAVNLAVIASRVALWLVATLAIYVVARLLGSRATYTMNLRASGFAQSAFVLLLLAAIPSLAPLARFITLAVTFFGAWIGASEANDLRGWRSLVLPILTVAIAVVGGYVLQALLQGVALGIEGLLQSLGLIS